MASNVERTENYAIDTGAICYYNVCCPYPNEDVGFNWLNYSYPFWHQHDHWELMLITEGQLLNSINNQRIPMKKGDICLICPNDKHRIDFVQNCEFCKHISFLIKNEYITNWMHCYGNNVLDSFLTREKVTVYNINDEKVYNIINSALNFKSFKMKTSEKVFQSKLIINDLLNIIIQQQFKQTRPMPDWMTSFLFYINNPYVDATNVNKLAEQTPYSYSRLAHIFKETTGRSIIDYIATVKIHHAKELLESSDMSIMEISTQLGYDSISNFNITFKKLTGMAPSVYRKQMLHQAPHV